MVFRETLTEMWGFRFFTRSGLSIILYLLQIFGTLKKYILLVFIFITDNYNASSQDVVDSLKIVLATENADTAKVDTYDDLAWETYLKGDWKEAIRYATEGMKLADSLHYEKGKANLYHKLGNAYYSMSDYPRSLENYLASLKIKEKLGFKKSLGSSYGSIGNVYQAQGDYKKALEYQMKSLTLRTETDDKYGMGVSMNNIGNVYGRTGQNDSAMKYFQAAVFVEEQIDDVYGLSQSLGNIGNIYKAQKKYRESLDYILKSLRLQEKIGDEQGIAGSYGNIGTLYLEQDNYAKALEYLNQSVKLSTKLGMKEYVRESYGDLAKTYEKLGQPAKALEYFKKFSALKDSLLNDESNKQIAQMSAQYESEKKDSEIKLLSKDKEKIEALATAESKKQKIIIVAVTTGFLFMMVFAIFVFRSNREKQRKNLEITEQKALIEERNREVHDSINYAKRIQTAILPPDKMIRDCLPDSFVLFKPKDIVSGDFYWLEAVGDKVFFAAVDCTGHGVPGAMVSVVGNSGLNRSVKEFGLSQPAAILDKLTLLVEETFSKSENEVKDGMDISICCINKKTNLLEWAGANNPLWLIRNNIVEEIKADKQPIGAFDHRKPFTNHAIQLNKGDAVYLFTDGYADQFGGEKGKKFKYKQLENLILTNNHLIMAEQKAMLDHSFESWRGSLEQIDDVCIIGVRI
jgi:serine phosphatase RsbU (regulator of sigma subunit)